MYPPTKTLRLPKMPNSTAGTQESATQVTPLEGKTEAPPPSARSDPFSNLAKGYPTLATRMGVIPSTAMFRRFGALNARNLLYLQNDLIQLEAELIELEKRDYQSGEYKEFYAHDSRWLFTSNVEIKGQPRDGDTDQRDMVIRMRDLLKEYNHALIQQSTILQMKSPDAFDLKDIQAFLWGDAMGPPWLMGPDKYVWGTVKKPDTYSRELVCLRAREEIDQFSRWLGARAIRYIKACGGYRWKKLDQSLGVISVRDESIFRLTFWVTSAIASLLPVASIWVLIKQDSLTGRLGTIAGFNALISICLTLFTDARRTDVFAVTAA
ncbi:hypothetical protein SLS60_011605 [Paraconiothyrium brasiliense]|uniref:DUF6594 domain-containing protein n=1 Tax=Paraconiothyrium brasiliense TaxID=300254 RepID=A0ABR3QIP1_9PLEO